MPAMRVRVGPGISVFGFRIYQKLIKGINLAFQGVTLVIRERIW